jgi:hypothetical protein
MIKEVETEMGKIISVWSPMKRSGKTVFLYILTKQLVNILDRKMKILACCLNLNHGNLMGLFGVGSTELNLEDMVNFKVYSANQSLDFFSTLAGSNNLYFIGSKKTSPEFAYNNLKAFEGLLQELQHSFDLMLIDTSSGDETPFTNMALEISDHVIEIINQDKEALDSDFHTREKDIACIVNMYRDIYPDEKELSFLYDLKNVFTLPCCNELQEMKNKGSLELYIQHETIFNKSVRDISYFLAKYLKLPIDKVAIAGQKRKSLFGGILGVLR